MKLLLTHKNWIVLKATSSALSCLFLRKGFIRGPLNFLGMCSSIHSIFVQKHGHTNPHRAPRRLQHIPLYRNKGTHRPTDTLNVRKIPCTTVHGTSHDDTSVPHDKHPTPTTSPSLGQRFLIRQIFTSKLNTSKDSSINTEFKTDEHVPHHNKPLACIKWPHRPTLDII